VRIAAVETRLDAADPLVDVGVVSEPVAALAGGAREDDVREPAQFLAVGLDGVVGLQVAEPIVTGSHREEDVLVNPWVVLELGEMIVIDEELRGSGA
jgi:hypothetical protein